MKLFLDTANTAHVGEIASWGILDGVTTNPTLAAKETHLLPSPAAAGTCLPAGREGTGERAKKRKGEGGDFKEIVLAMCKLVPCVSAQVTAEDFAGMKKQGEEYASWHKHVIVKVPMTTEGLKALKYFRSKGIRTNTTLVFSLNQAILSAKAGANIISPFIGRLDDAGEEGMDLIADILAAWQHYKFDTEVLVASIRHPRHVARAAMLGAHICTIPYEVFLKLPHHPLTNSGLKKFLDDWKNVKK